MANECIPISAVQNFAPKDTNRIVGQIGKVLARKAVWANVLKGGSLSNVSEIVRSVVQERAVVHSSLAEPVFTQDELLCGTGADADEVGSTEYQYGLASLRGQGPRVCVKTTRTAFEGSYLMAQQSLEKAILQIINSDVRATLTRRSGVKFVAQKGVTFDNMFTGESQRIDTRFASVLPTAPMNFKSLYKLGTVMREELLADPYSTGKGDYFMVIAGIDQIENFRNDADVKEDLRALTMGSFQIGKDAIAGYSFQGYREFAFGIDSQPLRYNVLDGNGQPVFIEPEIGVQVTNGKGARRNPAWVNAAYEIMHVIGADSFIRQLPERYVGEGTFKFAPQLSMGELEWTYFRDNDCNKFGDFGQHIYQISRAYRPMRPHAVCPIAFRRCLFASNLQNCLTSSTGL